MPLYFKELEKVFLKWYKLYNITKPTDCAASWVTYKRMQKNAKKTLIKKIIKLFNNIENSDMTVVPDLYDKNNFYIKIIHSKL